MTIRRPPTRPGTLWTTLALLAGVQAGCGLSTSTLELKSYRDPYFPEHYQVEFADCVYRVAPGGDIHVVGHTERSEADAPADPLTQSLHVHIYWQPHPGKTHAESSTSDAVLRYVVATDSGVAVYSGTGFAYPKSRRDGRIEVRIESARLRLESQSGDVPDVLGDTRVTGRLIATNDPAQAAALVRESELLAAR